MSSPITGDGHARSDHYERVQTAVDAAHARLTDRLPLDDLLDRWRAASRQLPNEPAPTIWLTKVQLDRARSEHRDALDQVAAAEARLATARTTGTKPWGRPDQDAIDKAFAWLDTSRAMARKREIEVRRLERRLAAERTAELARRPHLATITAVRASIDRRIDQALDQPAGYLLDVVGPRPKQRDKLETWTRTARAIETYRHHTGRTPATGAIGKGRIAAAIGPKPNVNLGIWTNAQQAIHEFDHPKRRERVLRRTM